MATSTTSAFQWADPLLLDAQLTDAERMIAKTARDFAQEKLGPRIVEAYLQEKTDRAIFSEMGELGLLGMTVSGGVRRSGRRLRRLWPGRRARSSGSTPATAR